MSWKCTKWKPYVRPRSSRCVMTIRSEHIGEQIRQVLGTALLFDVRDPYLEGATITRVRVSPDLQFADVRYSLLNDDQHDLDRAATGFERANGALRRIVASKVKMKKVPVLRFHFDDDLVHERRVAEILDELKGTDDSRET